MLMSSSSGASLGPSAPTHPNPPNPLPPEDPRARHSRPALAQAAASQHHAPNAGIGAQEEFHVAQQVKKLISSQRQLQGPGQWSQRRRPGPQHHHIDQLQDHGDGPQRGEHQWQSHGRSFCAPSRPGLPHGSDPPAVRSLGPLPLPYWGGHSGGRTSATTNGISARVRCGQIRREGPQTQRSDWLAETFRNPVGAAAQRQSEMVAQRTARATPPGLAGCHVGRIGLQHPWRRSFPAQHILPTLLYSRPGINRPGWSYHLAPSSGVSITLENFPNSFTVREK